MQSKTFFFHSFRYEMIPHLQSHVTHTIVCKLFLCVVALCYVFCFMKNVYPIAVRAKTHAFGKNNCSLIFWLQFVNEMLEVVFVVGGLKPMALLKNVSFTMM